MPQPRRGTGKLMPLGARHPRHAEVEQQIDAVLHELSNGVSGALSAVVDNRLLEDADARDLAFEILEQRLSSSSVDVPVAALDMLDLLGLDPFHAWDRIASTRGAANVLRMGARLRTGWPDDGIARKRVSFLKSMRGGDQALVELVVQGCFAWPMQVELLDEALNYLEALPSARRQAVVTQTAAAVGPMSLLLLHALLHMDDPALQRVVLQEVERFGQPVSIMSVERLAHTALDDTIRAAAALVAAALRTRPAPEPIEPRVLPALRVSTLSAPSAAGNQTVTVYRASNPPYLTMVHYVASSEGGVLGAYGVGLMTEDGLSLAREEYGRQGVEVIAVPIEASRGSVLRGTRLTARFGRPFPPQFELWEPLLHDTWPPAADEAVTIPVLDDAGHGDNRTLVRASAALFDHPFFYPWLLDEATTAMAMAMVEPPRLGKWTDRQYEPLIRQVVSIPVRDSLRHGLRMQAWLLDHIGEHELRDMALAVSASLVGVTTVELVEHPFLRRLMDETVATVLLDQLPVGDAFDFTADFDDDDDLDDEFEPGDVIDIEDHRR